MSAETTKTPASIARLARYYRSIALLLLNTVLLFVLLNVGLYIVLALREKYTLSGLPLSIYSEKAMAEVYPEYTRPEWKAMMTENWSRPLVYSDYVLFKERPFQGKYVNVSEAGFRQVKDQGPWPPDPANLNVFVFGGSTMFGYGVADEQTFASWLQEALAPHARKRLCVYNFGTGYYYSTQERLLFERLLSQGHKPDIAVFVDGLNDFGNLEDKPRFNEGVSSAFNGNTLRLILQKLPMTRFVQKLKRQGFSVSEEAARSGVQHVIERYDRNRNLLQTACTGFGIAPVFVWQPIPAYQYDTNYHLFYLHPEDYRAHAYGYPEMEKKYKQGALGDNFLWCADLQQGEKTCLYVDAHHYTAKFSKKLADTVAAKSIQSGILKRAGIEAEPVRKP